MRIATILAPVDFSEMSAPACEFALDLAERFHSRVILLHVIENKTLPDFEKFPLVRDPKALIVKVRKGLVAVTKAGGHPVVPVQEEVREGSPWREIVAAAREKRADLIVIASRGYTGLKHLLLGSVTERVLRHASCPVLVVRSLPKRRPRKAPPNSRTTCSIAPLTRPIA